MLFVENNQDRSNLITEFFTLGRQIIAGKARCGKTLLLYQELGYIPLYWELTERVLTCFGLYLRDCSLYQAVYASLYSYNRDAYVLHALCGSWCPTTNTLHTLSRELSISLWDLHRLGGLLIYGEIYDETIPSSQFFGHRDKHGQSDSIFVKLFVCRLQ